ncbi:MAG: hypothetical protein ABGZ23_00205 [Fuerstiella sp.]|nr:hypothetical protein [Fuerstiella sp.]
MQKASAEICQTECAARMAAIAEALVAEFGGVDGLVNVWHRTLEKAKKKGRHRRVAHMLIAQMKLLLLPECRCRACLNPLK